ncbi:MAG: GNAT family N-acetyltransferase [Candidatus Thorarchaeota archaeon]
MASERDNGAPSIKQRSYLIMKAEAKEALKLAEQWWSQKLVPSYVKIQRFDPTEVEDFVDLYNRCFLASPDPFCPLTVEQAQRLDPEGIFIAKMWGKSVGFIACFVEKKEDSIYGEITGIGVLPSRRRRGVATALIKQATEFFLDSGVEEVYIEVFEENIPSQMLIRAYGFREVGRRDVPIYASSTDDTSSDDLPGGKIMRRLGLRPRVGCQDCRDI